MNTIPSNSKFKPKLLKLILTLLIILTAVQFTTPITTYAQEDYEKNGSDGSGDGDSGESLNGTKSNGETKEVSYLYWAGSIHRTGYIMYMVNTETDQVLSGSDLGISGGGTSPFSVILIPTSAWEYFDDIDVKVYKTHFGQLTPTTVKTISSGMPLPVKSGGDSNWEGNTEALNEWLFTQTDTYSDGTPCYRFEELIAQSFGTGASEGKNIRDYFMEHKEVSLVLEPLSAHAIYSNQSWGTDALGYEFDIQANGYAFTDDENSLDYNYCFRESSLKPLLNSDGSIHRVLTTGLYAGTYSKIKNNGRVSGEGNEVWIHEELPYCMTLDEEQAGITPINTDSQYVHPDTVYTDGASKQTKGYAMVMFNRTVAYIHSYDINTNPSGPAKAEEPDPDENTDGNCSITKIYFDLNLDMLEGTMSYEYIGKHVRTNTTGYITIMPEQSQTGYRITAYKTSASALDLSPYLEDEKYLPLTYFLGGGNSVNSEVNLMLDTEENNHTNLYILYAKLNTDGEPPEAQEYDFEVPESYLTKQVFFSEANNTNHDGNGTASAYHFSHRSIEWLSDEFKCEGHQVINCDKWHVHKQHVENDVLVCMGCCYNHLPYIYYCTGTTDVCPNQHPAHARAGVADSANPCKHAVEYKCSNCGSTSTTSDGVTHSKDDCSSDDVSVSKYDYISPIYTYSCTKNCALAGTTTDGGRIDDHILSDCDGTFTLTKTECGIEIHDCYAYFGDEGTYLICEEEEHNCLTEGCLSNTVYCQPHLSDYFAHFELKNTKQNEFPTILANTGIAFDGNYPYLLNQRVINTIKNTSYEWVGYYRGTTDEDETDENVIFDYSTILLRGKDKVTIAQWKSANATAISRLDALTDQFYVGNTPHSTERWIGTHYTDTFSANFEDNSTDEQKTTTSYFTLAEGVSSGTWEWNGLDLSNGWRAFTEIFEEYEPCDDQDRIYTLQTPYNIPTIKVKVNVFSDYQDSNGPTQSGNTQVTFYPYVKMYYDTPSSKDNPVFILGEEQRTFEAHDSATITYANNTGILDLTSAQWSTHKSAKDTLLNLNSSADPSKILPGGAALDLSISQANTQTVIATTYQV